MEEAHIPESKLPPILKINVSEEDREWLKNWMDEHTTISTQGTSPLRVLDTECRIPRDRVDDLEEMFHTLEDYMMETKRISEANRADVERIAVLSRRMKGAMTATLILLIASVGATLLTAMLSMGII